MWRCGVGKFKKNIMKDDVNGFGDYVAQSGLDLGVGVEERLFLVGDMWMDLEI